MFIALVLSPGSAKRIEGEARLRGLIPEGWAVKCHHCTLAMGATHRFNLGFVKSFTVTGYGMTAGRVSAFRVDVPESFNIVPHITIAVAEGARPVESNDIAEWIDCDKFEVVGAIEICK